jgi:hypothetical protein
MACTNTAESMLNLAQVSTCKLKFVHALAYYDTATIGLHHPLDGVTNPKYKLLCFIQLNFFAMRRRH